MAGTEANESKGLAIASLVLAIISIIGCWIPGLNIFSIILAIIALILGVVGIVKKQGAMAIAGLVIAIISAVVTIAEYVGIFATMGTGIENFANNLNIEGLDIVSYEYNDSTGSGVVTGQVLNSSGRTITMPLVTFVAYQKGESEPIGTCYDEMFGELADGASWDFAADCQTEVTPDRVEAIGVSSVIDQDSDLEITFEEIDEEVTE